MHHAVMAVLMGFLSWSFASAVGAQPADAPAAPQGATASAAPTDQGWPRIFSKGDTVVVMHQPQVDAWEDYARIRFRCALAVTTAKEAPVRWGVLEVAARTLVDAQERQVLLTEPDAEVRFPGIADAEEANLRAIVRDVVPKRSSMVVSLDRVMAYRVGTPAARPVAVNTAPPAIFHSEREAILVSFAGPVRLKPIPGTSLMFAVNTNWDVIYDPAASRYYLLNGQAWLTTEDLLRGPFAPTDRLPADMARLPGDDNWADARAAVPARVLGRAPEVFVSTRPAELIVTEGPAEYSPIEGTGLMYVTNCEAPVLMDSKTRTHYFLAAGRWFAAPSLAGPWAGAPTPLPEGFARIPEQSPVGYVRASVPGTQEAMDAVLLASVPSTATVNRSEVTVNVVYDGPARFKPIEGTTVAYAVNTAYDVFEVERRFYCCHQGVWFWAAAASGPWAVCDAVPVAIYSIPPSSPKHIVTYVYVYDSSPTTVTVGSTAGYSGQFVAATGVVMFGLGVLVAEALDDDCDWCRPGPWWYSYGCGAIYRPHVGGFWCGGYRWYGPYGGAGGGAIYNPHTGAWVRGGYRYGPGGAVAERAGYNPWTDTYAARVGVATPYGTWTRGVVTRGDAWVRGGTRTTDRGSAGWVETSRGGGAVRVDPRGPGQTTIVRDADGDVYVGKDGKIYKRSEDGGWETRSGDRWERVNAPENRPGDGRAPVSPATTDRRPAPADLDEQARARERGNAGTQRFERSRSAPARPPARRR